MEEEEEYATLPVKEGSNESWATFESKNEDNNEEWVTLPTRDEEEQPLVASDERRSSPSSGCEGNHQEWVTLPTRDEEEQPLVASDERRTSPSSVSEANAQEAQQLTKNVESGNQHEQPAAMVGTVPKFILAVDAFINHQDISKLVAFLNDLDVREHGDLRNLLEPQEDIDESKDDSDESEDDATDESLPFTDTNMKQWVKRTSARSPSPVR